MLQFKDYSQFAGVLLIMFTLLKQLLGLWHFTSICTH